MQKGPTTADLSAGVRGMVRDTVHRNDDENDIEKLFNLGWKSYGKKGDREAVFEVWYLL